MVMHTHYHVNLGRRPMKSAANDPSTDPVITFAIRYLRPISLAGMVLAIAMLAWVLSL